MKLIESYFYLLNEIKLITNNEIESEAETELIFGSLKLKKYFGKHFDKIDIFGKYSDLVIKKDIISKFNEILKKRFKGIPIQYILDEAWFYGHRFHVYEDKNSKSLIPRNETEFIVEGLIKKLKMNKLIKFTALDIGTGSCCIPISVILNTNKNVCFDAVEPYSFDIANKNISKYKLNSYINLYKIGIDEIPNIIKKKYDYISANLPYISKKNKIRELRFEPNEALYAGDDGFSYIKKLIKILPEILNKNGIAFIEIDPSQSNYFRSLDYFICEIKKDFNNLDRMVTLKFK
tara:strand:- start:2139 stop:3011 length:873 start_codon:yes stop_codon:yes gene_type:complete